jgi:hypothetical protein
MNLSEMRTRVRRDLHDEDADNYRWSDDELDRHVDHAVRELSAASPREAVTTLYTTEGSRELSLSGLDGLVQIEAVEYPVGRHPPRYVRYSVWADTLTLLTDRTPGEAEEVKLFYGCLHTLDAEGSTIPQRLEDLIALGAEGYASLEWASFATNRVNVGGPDTWHSYLTWGQEQLARFHRRLARLGRRASLRARRLYVPAQEPMGQTEVQGP